MAPKNKMGSKTPQGAAPVKGQQKISAFFVARPAASPSAPASAGASPAPSSGTPVPTSGAAAPGTGAGRGGSSARPTSLAEQQLSAGTRLRVFWPDDNKWFKGTVGLFNAQDGKHKVKYDDGDVEWLHLSSERYELLPAKECGSSKQPAAKGTPHEAELEDEGVELPAGAPLPSDEEGVVKGTKRRRLVRGAPTGPRQPKAPRPGRRSCGDRKGLAMEVDGSDEEQEDSTSAEEESSASEAGEPSSSEDDVELEDEEDEEHEEEVEEAGTPADQRKRKRAPASAAKASGTKKRSTSTALTATPKPGAAATQRTPSAAGAAAPTATPSAAGAAASTRPAAATPATGTTITAASQRRTPGSATPQSGTRNRLHGTLDVGANAGSGTPATGGKQAVELVHGFDVRLNNEDAGRFGARMVQRFPFLHPSRIMDAQKRQPSHHDYDPSTLYVPPSWFKEMKVSEGQQQWWSFKVVNFDSVLLFKMGKFYEMFEMDAYVGVDVLGLTFMKGDQPHAGFPEVRYHDMAEALARAGYRVVVVEQTETPEQLAKRNEERRRQGIKLANVVSREKVAVLSKGTLIDAEMVASKPDPSYVLAVVELPAPADRPDLTLVTRLGVAAVDVASGHVLVGEFLDDEVRSSLRTHLAALQPVELVLPGRLAGAAGGVAESGSSAAGAGLRLDAVTQRVLKTALRSPRVNSAGGGKAAAWSPQALIKLFQERRYFQLQATASADDKGNGDGAFAVWPPVLRALARAWSDAQADSVAGQGAAEAAQGTAALSALCGLCLFLREALLDLAVLPQGRVEALPTLVAARSSSAAAATPRPLGSDEPLNMLLNGSALENLEILENADSGSAGSLLSVVDSCCTPFGRRRLRSWLCRPLYRCADIIHRQDAVAALAVAPDVVGAARRQLGGVSDLERAVARLFASTVEGAAGRDAANVVLYEDGAKRKVKALTSAFKDLQAVARAAQELRAAVPEQARAGQDPDDNDKALLDEGKEEAAAPQGRGSEGPAAVGSGSRRPLLQQLTGERQWDQVQSCLAALQASADWKQAEVTGRVVPAEGVNEAYDHAMGGIANAEEALANHLKEVRAQVSGAGAREVQYVSGKQSKESHVVEVPENAKVPRDFTLVGQRKGFKRFTSARLAQLCADLADAEQAKETALANILQELVAQFCRERRLWCWAVDAVAELDALMSLASHAAHMEGAVCRPEILEPQWRGRRKPSPAAEPSPMQGDGAEAEPEEGLEEVTVLEARGLRHPAGLPGRGGAFVPNDIVLGGETHAPFILLSGPNMGGKSTLLRQACLAAVLAQVGAFVPAESLRLTPVDAVFVRMGAKDSIMTGQSTFFVELAETAAMLHKATPRSLVALDELGRGTATLDGAAIASAVLEHMAGRVHCRGLFATHYHHLSTEHARDPRVAVMHMACAVGGQAEDGEAEGDAHGPGAMDMDGASEAVLQDLPRKQDAVPEVTFLYKLTPGACPKSYGTNVARLAGLPAGLVERAACMSESTQVRAKQSALQAAVAAAQAAVRRLRPVVAAAAPGVVQLAQAVYAAKEDLAQLSAA